MQYNYYIVANGFALMAFGDTKEECIGYYNRNREGGTPRLTLDANDMETFDPADYDSSADWPFMLIGEYYGASARTSASIAPGSTERARKAMTSIGELHRGELVLVDAQTAEGMGFADPE